MSKAITVNKSQIKGNIGQIFNGTRHPEYKYLIDAYIYGDIPIKLESNVNQELFDRMCESKLTPSDRFELRIMGLL